MLKNWFVEAEGENGYERDCLPGVAETGCEDVDIGAITGEGCICDTDGCNSAGKVGLSVTLMAAIAIAAAVYN